MRLFLDLETYSEVDLKKAGAYAYAEHPSTEILMAGFSIDGKPARVVQGHQDSIDALRSWLVDPDVLKIAHNSQFDRVVLSEALGMWLGPEGWTDTAALAAINGLPRSLDQVAKALGAEEKDSAGTRLINIFSKPDRKGVRTTGEDRPDLWSQFVDYARQDVDTLVDVWNRIPDWPTPQEYQVWLADQRINDRGIKADRPLARWAVRVDSQNQEQMSARARELLGIENPGSVQQFTQGLASLGVSLPDLRAETVRGALEYPDLSPEAREALSLRLELSLVASKKYQAVLDQSSQDGRVRGQFLYAGAHTGRWSGRGIQLQNLPRAQLDHPEAVILDSLLGLGADPEDLKALVRQVLVGPFTVADYAAIEARVLAWVAPEEWAIEAFREGRDIYVETAKRMGGMTRQQGKTAVLALGYQGGVNSLRHMGAEGSGEQLMFMRDQWRRANQNIVSLWRTTEEAFAQGGQAGRLRVDVEGNDRHLILPSGRHLTYRRVRREKYRTPDGSYETAWRFDGARGRTETYGGRLVENAVQAISRDLLADLLLKMLDSGLDVVGHVHDEVIVQGQDARQKVLEMMEQGPEWAEGLPLSGEAFTCERYRKG